MSLVVLQRILLHINCMLVCCWAPNHHIFVTIAYLIIIIIIIFCVCMLFHIILFSYCDYFYFYILFSFFWMKEGWLWDCCWHLPIMVINYYTPGNSSFWCCLYTLYYPIFNFYCIYFYQKTCLHVFVKCQQEVL